MVRRVLRVWLLWLVGFVLLVSAPGVAEGLSALVGGDDHACRCPPTLQGCLCVTGQTMPCHGPAAKAATVEADARAAGQDVLKHRCRLAEDPALAQGHALPAQVVAVPEARVWVVQAARPSPAAGLSSRPAEPPDRPS